MIAEVRLCLEKARQCLDRAAVIHGLAIHDIAGREAYLAAYHAAQALILDRTGRIARTHKGARTLLAEMARADTALAPLVMFLARAYELKSLADYGVGPEAQVSADAAQAAITTAGALLDQVAALLASS